MAHILDVLKDKVLLCDGGMGTSLQDFDLDVEKDFWGHENCSDILVQSAPDVVREVHRGFFKAGSDMVLANTFGASPVTLGEFGLQDKAFELCQQGVELAREVADEFASDGRDRFIIGDIGPGTKLPTLAHIDYQSLEDSFGVQAAGLVAGGCDAILIETCQDPLQIKAAVNGAKKARKEAGREDTPIFVQVTVETTGTMLVGTDIAAATTIIDAMGVDSLGLNCATGPQEMADHVKHLSENWTGLISVQPNAGLPELVDGQTHYPLSGDDLAGWLERFIKEDGINIVGGCCGTTHIHMAAIHKMLEGIAEPGSHRPAPRQRTPNPTPGCASLYNSVAYRQENAFFSIGERCNANGSKKFRELLDAEDWDGCVKVARDQVRDGSSSIDVCTAMVGRDESRDMHHVVEQMRGSVTAPLVFDSTETPVLEEALQLYGGKAIINSINFEDGEEEAGRRLELARKYGAAVVALTIDEDGMAKTADKKLEIAKRLYDFAVNKHGLPAHDLMFDPLTFTICTGNEDDRHLAMETLDAIKRISEEMPEVQIVLGLSNVSFGLKPAARHVLNSVFLHHAVQHGMTGAIVHLTKILPMHKIPEEEVKAAEDLIYDRREGDYDPLHALIGLFVDKKVETAAEDTTPKTPEERLKQRIIDGDRKGLDEDINEALKTHDPLNIINDILLGGMKVVGELFGSGQMQLPFVLQSAETMKAAVALLEPHMPKKEEGDTKGTMVLATVKGDVHDIGKNLVDIIMSNNGYTVHNIGIKKTAQEIIEAVKEHKPDAVGMSGLLVKSTVIMRENLEEMTREGIDIPVFLGGAALTRKYVEEDCRDAYGSRRVAYAKDAFDGLTLMDKVMDGSFEEMIGGEGDKAPAAPKAEPSVADAQQRPIDWEEVKTRRDELTRDVAVPTPPFFGSKVLEQIDPKALLSYLNERMLFQFHWGFKKQGKSLDDFMTWAETEVRPILNRMMDICRQENILQPQAAYGYWKCAAEQNSVILFDDDGETEKARFTFPRQNRENGLCIADFFRDVDTGERDVIGLQAVTIGQRASDVAREWFAGDRYQDYLYLHGLGVEMAEALAEYVHKRIRSELGFGHEDAREREKLLKQGYRGSRYSFGYPACPNMEDQHPLLDLLGADRIGLRMDEHDQLHPEQSTAAVVVHHPQAKYFSV